MMESHICGRDWCNSRGKILLQGCRGVQVVHDEAKSSKIDAEIVGRRLELVEVTSWSSLAELERRNSRACLPNDYE